nr:AlpA family transcriptional regulator [Halovibrio salipaludis]
MANPNPNEVKNQPETLNRLPEVMRRTAMSRSSIYLAMKRGQFPRPVSLTGSRAVAWRESDIQRWIDERAGGNAT